MIAIIRNNKPVMKRYLLPSSFSSDAADIDVDTGTDDVERMGTGTTTKRKLLCDMFVIRAIA